jgi:hypothetical protein
MKCLLLLMVLMAGIEGTYSGEATQTGGLVFLALPATASSQAVRFEVSRLDVEK